MVKNNTTTTYNNNNNNNQPQNPNKKMLIGIIWTSSPDLKLLLSSLLFLFSLITLFQFFPNYSHLTFSVQDLRRCSTTLTPPPPPPPPPHIPTNTKLQNDIVLKRNFHTYGSAAYNFILMSAYRGGAATFAVTGLSSKPLHVFSKPTYTCEWVPHNPTGEVAGEVAGKVAGKNSTTVAGEKFLPDWGYGRVYTVVVVNCTFPAAVGDGGAGGKLLLHAAVNGGGGDAAVNVTDTFVAVTEAPGTANFSRYETAPEYDYLYCGSPVYGNLSPQRVREWVAYHVRLFGDRARFVLHDAGGIHADVMAVLRPWMEKGFVTVEDVRDQERFDGYYHNQFLIVNDCLHRYRFMAKWMFFFDLDEFIFVPKKSTIKTVMDSLSEYTQFTIEQRTMSNKLCYLDDNVGKIYRKWGIEKLVYRDSVTGIRRDRKYAVQPRNVFATGVHMSENVLGKTTHDTEGKIMYYHYHGTISERREPCRQLVNTTTMKVGGTPYVVDKTMREVAGAVKRFEIRTIGPVLIRTKQ